MFLCQRYTSEKLKDIGIYFGIGESGVSQARRRVKDKMKNEDLTPMFSLNTINTIGGSAYADGQYKSRSSEFIERYS